LEYFFGHYFSNVSNRLIFFLILNIKKIFSGRIRPFSKLLEEMERTSDSENFFHRLARIISDGHVLRYISYQPEIPRDM
jgi:hypothetical protein